MKEITLPELSGGLNTRDPEYSINDNQSPDLLNVWWKNKSLSKRSGQEFVTTLANVYRISDEYNGYQAVHAGTKLYKWDGSTATEIKTGIQNSAGVFVEFGDDLYYIDGVEIWHISSAYTVAAITPYKPVVSINSAPDRSSSDDNESYNLIGAGFTVKYNGNGTSTTYTLPQTALDATTVTVSINNVTKTEGTHFTVNRTAGTVNFAAGTSPNGAPAAGTNNVWITAYKTVSGNKSKIAKCKIGMPYGGEASGVFGGTRVFAMRNSDYPFYYWRSDLSSGYGMTYWPDTSEELLDQNSESIMAAAKMGEFLIIFKKRSTFAISYSFDGQDVYYPVREVHSSRGCDVPNSVQLIDNSLVFAHSVDGIQILTGIDNNLETNIKPISGNINSLFLAETNLANACSADYDQYYFLAVNGNVYLWDYGATPYYNYSDYDKAQRRLAWYKWDGIDAGVFYVGSDLYYGNTTGIARLIEKKNDFDSGYTCYFKTKAFDMGDPSMLKTVLNVFPSFSTDGNVKTTVTVANEKTDEFRQKTYDIRSFDWSEFSWAAFTWAKITYVKTFRMRTKMKKITHMQITFESNEANRGLGVTGIRAEYFEQAKVKGA